MFEIKETSLNFDLYKNGRLFARWMKARLYNGAFPTIKLVEDWIENAEKFSA